LLNENGGLRGSYREKLARIKAIDRKGNRATVVD